MKEATDEKRTGTQNIILEVKRNIWLSNANLEQLSINLATIKPMVDALNRMYSNNGGDIVIRKLQTAGKKLPEIGKAIDDLKIDMDKFTKKIIATIESDEEE